MFEIVCERCGAKIYAGDEVKSPRQILRLYKGRCKKCGAKLDPEDFELFVSSSV
jgi:DNA-directed RNA polymerase subunit RPC12/RpoP